MATRARSCGRFRRSWWAWREGGAGWSGGGEGARPRRACGRWVGGGRRGVREAAGVAVPPLQPPGVGVRVMMSISTGRTGGGEEGSDAGDGRRWHCQERTPSDPRPAPHAHIPRFPARLGGPAAGPTGPPSPPPPPPPPPTAMAGRLTAQQRERVAAFRSATGASERVAAQFLAAHGWALNASVNALYESGGSGGGSKRAPSAATLGALFASYADEDDPDVMRAEGVARFCEDLKVGGQGGGRGEGGWAQARRTHRTAPLRPIACFRGRPRPLPPPPHLAPAPRSIPLTPSSWSSATTSGPRSRASSRRRSSLGAWPAWAASPPPTCGPPCPGCVPP